LLTDAREVSVVQLELLDRTIGKEYIGVPLDATTKAELIDLMARILVTVFKAEGERDDRSPVQFQNQAGAPGSESHRLPPAIQREAGAGKSGEPTPPV
jgi:hypothetical protein